ncbi:MAG: hypothetical protein ABR981_00090 [Candidatus Micrarchaeaceae archaeon]|jgi:post-segregation antitoxin (ccd killing protein)
MVYEEAILVKIDKNTKRRMRNVKVNWSEAIREFIQKEISNKRNIAKAEKLRAKLFRSAKGTESTEIIRKMRDSRYGPNST